MSSSVRLTDAEYMIKNNIAGFLNDCVGDVLTKRPEEIISELAMWSMANLPNNKRREIAQNVESSPSEAQLLGRVTRKAPLMPNNQLALNSSYNVYQDPAPGTPHVTKIVATLGPSSTSVDEIRALIRAGTNVLRINLSHIGGSTDAAWVRLVVANARKACELEGDAIVGIALDTRGAGVIRTGNVDTTHPVRLAKGSNVTLQSSNPDEVCKGDRLYVGGTFNPLVACPVGTVVFVDDGHLQLKVTEVKSPTEVLCVVTHPHELLPQKVVHIRGVTSEAKSILTDEDIADIKTFVPELNIDFLFATGVRTVEDIKSIEAIIPTGVHVAIYSKIENRQAMENLDAIIKASDGVVVWRSELGLTYPVEDMFLIQKKIISSCNLHGRPVVCATHMLDSMTRNPRPTRAEASDAANAVLDGADGVLLSAETAIGINAAVSVETMKSICLEAQASLATGYITAAVRLLRPHPLEPNEAICSAVTEAAYQVKAKGIVCASSLRGDTVRMISQYAPPCPVIAVCTTIAAARRVTLERGVIPVHYKSEVMDREERMNYGVTYGVTNKLWASGDLVILVHADHHTELGKGFANIYRIVSVP
eukprot:PhF_6_TR2350/c0_g1_i1/m.4211/K00873/PK, pyk; pyruvate kinase